MTLVVLVCVTFFVLYDLCRVPEGLRLKYLGASVVASALASGAACFAFFWALNGCRLLSGDWVFLFCFQLAILVCAAVFAVIFREVLKQMGKLLVRWQRLTPEQYEQFFQCRKVASQD